MSKVRAYIALIISSAIWSISFVSIDICLEILSPGEINIIRFSLASFVLFVIFLLRRDKFRFERKDTFKMIASGILGTAGYYYFENQGLLYISAGAVSTITGAIPIMTIVIAMLFLNYKTRLRNIIAILLSFSGILILSNVTPQMQAITSKGVSLVLVGNICWIIYTLVNENLNRKYDKLQLLTVQMLTGTVVFYILYFIELDLGHTNLLRIQVIQDNPHLIYQLIFLSIGSSVVAYYLYNYALAEIGVTISALFINVIPVLTLIISVGLKMETLTFSKIMGCLLVVVAVYIIDDKSKGEPR